MPAGENQLVKKHPGVLLALGGEQVFHVRRQTTDHFHAQVETVFLYVPVGGHIVEMLGGGDLTGKFAGQIDAVGFDQFNETMELVRGDEGVDGVAEENELGLLQGGPHRRKVLFTAPDALTHR